MTTKKRWQDLSKGQQMAVIAGAAVQLGLLTAALNDVTKRAPKEINGPKPMWIALCFVNFVGPISYFVFGRRRSH